MKCLFVSSLASQKIISQIYHNSNQNPGFAGLKFRNLLARGIQLNDVEVTALSAIPMSRSLTKRLIWFNDAEVSDDLSYHYIPFLNIPYIRQAMLFVYTFFYVLSWGIKYRKEGFVICDMLNISLCEAVLCVKKIIRLKTVGVLTDMPGLMVSRTNTHSSSLAVKLNKAYLSSFDYYVFLSKEMNDIVNKYHSPYVIIEGFSENKLNQKLNKPQSDKFIIMYAGGLHSRYGLKMLADAIEQIDYDFVELRLYGDGPFVEEMRSYNYKKVKYCGILLNDEIVREEKKADLLINPRPTSEEFTRYSFPSKNIEYMASGTPLATTRLPSMPSEYYPYVYLLDDESVEGYKRTIRKIIELPAIELERKGVSAQKFIFENKTNIIQAEKIISMIEKFQ